MAQAVPAGWFPRRGEVYLVMLDKERPAVILSTNALNRHALDVCVVPITHVERKKFRIRPLLRAGESGLDVNSWAKCDQVTTLEKALLAYPSLGTLSTSSLRAIEKGVRAALKLP